MPFCLNIVFLSVLPGQCLGPNTPQPESQLQSYDLIKQCQQVNKCNGCGALFDKADKKL